MTRAQLYSILMESETAYRKAQELCEMLGVPYPPEPHDHTEIEIGSPAAC